MFYVIIYYIYYINPSLHTQLPSTYKSKLTTMNISITPTKPSPSRLKRFILSGWLEILGYLFLIASLCYCHISIFPFH